MKKDLGAAEPKDRYGQPTTGAKLCPACHCVLSTARYDGPSNTMTEVAPYCSNFVCGECWAWKDGRDILDSHGGGAVK